MAWFLSIKGCSGSGCKQGRQPERCDCGLVTRRPDLERRSTWKETVMDTLVGDCPPADDVDLPGDGSRRVVGLRICAGVALVVLLCLLIWAIS